MGKNKDKKKKGLGIEKTLAKTEKKNQKRLKKELDELGEDEIENLINEFKEKDKELTQVKEDVIEGAPSARTGASFNLLPEKDEIVLFGGEYYDGSKVYMYNELYIYNIKKNQWSQMKIPKGPPPRSSHQGVIVSRNQGELWIFGGEFASPSQSQFYHYNDLWVLRFQTKQWEKINAPNGPSARSGHRMTLYKKYLVVFGGFHDNNVNCKYFNDTYIFDLETNQWQELKFSGVNEMPSPRSGCQLSVSTKNNAVVVYGGFSKEKLKKNKEKGVVHTDMFALSQDVKKDGKVEWHWKKVKQTGLKPSDRCSFTMVTLMDDTALLFGGVYDYENPEDEESDDEENQKSVFYNDLYRLDLANYKWSHVKLKGKRATKKTKAAKKQGSADNSTENVENEEESDEEMETEANEEDLEINKLKIKDNDVFALSYNAKPEGGDKEAPREVVTIAENEPQPFVPHARRSALMQFHKGTLYLYGGCIEASNEKEITLRDMHCLSVKKMDEWKTLIEDKKVENLNNLKDDDSSNESDDDEDEDDSEMEIDAPELEDNESVDVYFERTRDFWLEEAQKEFPTEKSKKVLNKMALELCNMFYETVKGSASN